MVMKNHGENREKVMKDVLLDRKWENPCYFAGKMLGKPQKPMFVLDRNR